MSVSIMPGATALTRTFRGGQFLGQGAGQAVDAALAGGVVDLPAGGELGGRARQVHDAARAAASSSAGYGVAVVERSAEVRSITSRHCSCGHGPQQPVLDDAGRVDQHVDLPPLLEQLIDDLVGPLRDRGRRPARRGPRPAADFSSATRLGGPAGCCW